MQHHTSAIVLLFHTTYTLYICLLDTTLSHVEDLIFIFRKGVINLAYCAL